MRLLQGQQSTSWDTTYKKACWTWQLKVLNRLRITKWVRCLGGSTECLESGHRVSLFGIKYTVRHSLSSSAVSVRQPLILVSWYRPYSIMAASDWLELHSTSLSLNPTTFLLNSISFSSTLTLKLTTLALLITTLYFKPAWSNLLFNLTSNYDLC